MTCGLGLVPDALDGRLRIRRPSLPRWLGRVEVRGLRIADATRRPAASSARTAGWRWPTCGSTGDIEVVLEISASRDPGDDDY